MDTETGRKATRDALDEAAREIGREPAVVQGNFDPRLLTDSSPMSAVNVSLLYVVSGRHSPLRYKQCQLWPDRCDTGPQERNACDVLKIYCFCLFLVVSLSGVLPCRLLYSFICRGKQSHATYTECPCPSVHSIQCCMQISELRGVCNDLGVLTKNPNAGPLLFRSAKRLQP